MPKARKSNRTLVPQARQALDQMKYEVANELNIPTHLIEGGLLGEISAPAIVDLSAETWFGG